MGKATAGYSTRGPPHRENSKQRTGVPVLAVSRQLRCGGHSHRGVQDRCALRHGRTERFGVNGTREAGIDQKGVRRGGGHAFEEVDRSPVGAAQRARAAREQKVREMAVKHDVGAREPLEQRHDQ